MSFRQGLSAGARAGSGREGSGVGLNNSGSKALKRSESDHVSVSVHDR